MHRRRTPVTRKVGGNQLPRSQAQPIEFSHIASFNASMASSLRRSLPYGCNGGGHNDVRLSKRKRNTYPSPEDLKLEVLVPNKLKFPSIPHYVEWKKEYDEWKQKMWEVIKSGGLLGFIDGTVEAPPKTVTTSVNGPNGSNTIHEEREIKEYVDWKGLDDLVQEWIRNRLEWFMSLILSRFETAKELWEGIARMVDTKGRLGDYLPLYKATIEGDWEKAEAFIREKPEAVRAGITFDSETALIVAVKLKRRNKFVEKLVDKMRKEDVALFDDFGRTALHRAAGAGNIKAAEVLLGKNRDLIDIKETRYNQTPLYYAAARGDREMILSLMKKMKTKRLEGGPGFHILYQLTHNRLYDIALTVLQENIELASFIPNKEKDLKFHALTALAEQPSSFKSGNTFNFLQELIYFGLNVFNFKPQPQHPNYTEPGLKILPKKDEGLELENIADYPSRGDIEAPPTCNNFGGWGYAMKKRLLAMISKVTGTFDQLLIKPIQEIREKKLRQDQALKLLQFLCNKVIESDFTKAYRIFRLSLEQATMMGIPEIVEEILELYPYAVSFENHKKQTVFQQAIVFRQEKVFNLIRQLEESAVIVLSKIDACNNNALHLAGYVAHPHQLYLKAGAALQMQRELQWFKEVERLVLQKNREDRNNEKKTPKQVFSDEHKELVKEGERWMKDTANSCTIVASLIATVVFAAAIQVPGGNNDNGHPIFNQQSAFIVFGIANSLALFFSIASVIMFLSILTSPCAEEDFLFALPNRMTIGLGSLLLSILFTMTAFGAILYLVFGENKGWILIPIVALGCYPVYLFVALQFPFLKDMMKSTYGSGIFVKQSDRMLQ